MGALFCFGAGFVLGGLPTAIAAGTAALVSSVAAGILTKMGQERGLSRGSISLLVAGTTFAAFTLVEAIFPLQGALGLGFGFSLWLVIRTWPGLFIKV